MTSATSDFEVPWVEKYRPTKLDDVSEQQTSFMQTALKNLHLCSIWSVCLSAVYNHHSSRERAGVARGNDLSRVPLACVLCHGAGKLTHVSRAWYAPLLTWATLLVDIKQHVMWSTDRAKLQI